MSVLIALAAALAPAMSIPMVSYWEMTKLRSWWLVGTLALGSLWLLWHEPWLGLMGLWFVIRWRADPARDSYHPSLITWAAIAGGWFLLRGLPGWAWTAIPWVWLAIMVWHVWRCVRCLWTDRKPYERRPLGNIWRTKATQGSPANTALFFCLCAPFCPWWLWPVLGLGLYITWSWLAFVGVAAGLMVLHPSAAPWLLLTGMVVLAAWFISWRTGRKLFEWTPRGDSFDSVINRLIVWYLIVTAWWAGPRWLGRGPYTLDKELSRWSTRCWIELPTGEAFCDPLQHLYEYGLLGTLGVVAFAVPLLHRWFGGGGPDPWTAAAIAGFVIAWGHHPHRHPTIALMLLTIYAGVGR